MIEAFCRFEGPTGRNQNFPPVVNTPLEGVVHFRYRFDFGHIEVLQIGVVHKESPHQVKFCSCDGTFEMNAVPFPLVRLYHCYARECPFCRRRPIPLAHPLCFLPISRARICLRVSKSCPTKEPHVLNSG